MSDENHEIEINSIWETQDERIKVIGLLINHDDHGGCTGLSPEFVVLDNATQQQLLTTWIEYLEVIKAHVVAQAEPEAEESLH